MLFLWIWNRKNYKEAFEWYSKSANNGCVKGQYNLGCCYQNGQEWHKIIRKNLNGTPNQLIMDFLKLILCREMLSYGIGTEVNIQRQ